MKEEKRVKYSDYSKVKEMFSLIQEKRAKLLCYTIDGNDGFYYYEVLK